MIMCVVVCYVSFVVCWLSVVVCCLLLVMRRYVFLFCRVFDVYVVWLRVCLLFVYILMGGCVGCCLFVVCCLLFVVSCLLCVNWLLMFVL